MYYKITAIHPCITEYTLPCAPVRLESVYPSRVGASAASEINMHVGYWYSANPIMQEELQQIQALAKEQELQITNIFLCTDIVPNKEYTTNVADYMKCQIGTPFFAQYKTNDTWRVEHAFFIGFDALGAMVWFRRNGMPWKLCFSRSEFKTMLCGNCAIGTYFAQQTDTGEYRTVIHATEQLYDKLNRTEIHHIAPAAPKVALQMLRTATDLPIVPHGRHRVRYGSDGLVITPNSIRWNVELPNDPVPTSIIITYVYKGQRAGAGWYIFPSLMNPIKS